MKQRNPAVRVLKFAVLVAIVVILRHAPPWLRRMFDFTPMMRFSLILWLVFSVYWSIAARRRAEDKSSESIASRQFHLLLVNVAMVLLVFSIPGLTQRFLPESREFAIAGLSIQAASILFAAWARQHLGRNWSGEVRIASEHQLVRSGPYRYLRHPIYTAVLGMYVGTLLVSGEIHAVLALALVTAAYLRKIAMEESALSDAFGVEHEQYRRDTWKLFPGL